MRACGQGLRLTLNHLRIAQSHFIDLHQRLLLVGKLVEMDNFKQLGSAF